MFPLYDTYEISQSWQSMDCPSPLHPVFEAKKRVEEVDRMDGRLTRVLERTERRSCPPLTLQRTMPGAVSLQAAPQGVGWLWLPFL